MAAQKVLGVDSDKLAEASQDPKTEERLSIESPLNNKLVIVDLGKRQSRRQVKRLRKGRGKLVTRVEGLVKELINTSPEHNRDPAVVIVVVREKSKKTLWPFG